MADMTEDIFDQLTHLAFSAPHMTEEVFNQTVGNFADGINGLNQDMTKKHGDINLTQLKSQGYEIANIDITGENTGNFRRFARKYGIDFSMKRIKNPETGKKRDYVFFKAKDGETMRKALTEYAKYVDEKARKREERQREPYKERKEKARETQKERSAERGADRQKTRGQDKTTPNI